MELSGALLNPRLQVELPPLARLREVLGRRDGATPPARGTTRRRQGSVLAAVATVLEGADGPMRVRDIHAEVERAFRDAVPFSSVNQALSTHANGCQSRFRRVRYGVYEMRTSLDSFEFLA